MIRIWYVGTYVSKIISFLFFAMYVSFILELKRKEREKKF